LKRRRRSFLALAACVLLGLAVLEFVLHVFVLPNHWRPLPPFGRRLTESQAAWLARQQDELAGAPSTSSVGAFDAELGWNNQPGAENDQCTIHAGGWRGPRDYALPAPDGITRLVAFGESFTFGHEVTDDATWETQLEALDPRLEVVNFGVGGYGTDQALLRAERELARADADVVLVGLMLENIGRNVNRYRPLWMPQAYSPVAKPRFVLEDSALRLVPLPFRDRAEYVRAVEDGTIVDRLHAHERWSDAAPPPWLAWSACARLYLGRRAYHARNTPDLWLERGEAFQVTLALLARFRALAREHGARDAVVLIFPARTDMDSLLEQSGKYWTSLLDELARSAAPHLDLSDALLAAARTSGAEPLYGIGHLSRAGNAVVARALHAWLADWL
jgi:hypothetical protein